MQAATTTTLGSLLSPRWHDWLDDDLLGIGADTEVGLRCAALLRKAEELCALMDDADHISNVCTSAADQCHVWYFG